MTDRIIPYYKTSMCKNKGATRVAPNYFVYQFINLLDFVKIYLPMQ